MEIRKKKKMIVYLGFGGVVLILFTLVIDVIMYQNMKELLQRDQEKMNVYKTVELLRRLEADLNLALVSQRDFVITGREEYLEHFSHNQPLVKQEIQELRQFLMLTIGTQDILDTLETLVDKKFAALQVMVDIRKKEGFVSEIQELLDNPAQFFLKDIQKLLAEINRAENLVLKSTLEKTEATSQQNFVMVILGNLAAFVLSFVSIYLLNQQITHRMRVEQALRVERDRLEIVTHNIQQQQKQLQDQNRSLQERNTLINEQREQLIELNACKDKFISIISHDLQSPFAGIFMLAEIIRQNAEKQGDKEIKQLADQLQASVENYHALLENLLTWAKIQQRIISYQLQPVDLHLIFARNIALFTPHAKQKQITFRSSIPERIVIHADINMIDTVVRNLLSNAIKFTEAGGIVEAAVTPIEHAVEVAVSDTGIGIQREELAKLFQIESKYQRTGTSGEKGTGLGLILCKEFIEKHGGRIWVESEEGKGTIFRFTLPSKEE